MGYPGILIMSSNSDTTDKVSEPEADQSVPQELTSGEPKLQASGAEVPEPEKIRLEEPETIPEESETEESVIKEPVTRKLELEEPVAEETIPEEPEVSEPEVSEPEVSVPEVSVPEASVPEAPEPEAPEPEAPEPEASVPEVSVPEAPRAEEPATVEPALKEPELRGIEFNTSELEEPDLSLLSKNSNKKPVLAEPADAATNSSINEKEKITRAIKSFINGEKDNAPSATTKQTSAGKQFHDRRDVITRIHPR